MIALLMWFIKVPIFCIFCCKHMYVYQYKFDKSFDDWMRKEWMSFWNIYMMERERFCLLLIFMFLMSFEGLSLVVHDGKILVEQQRQKWSWHKKHLTIHKKDDILITYRKDDFPNTKMTKVSLTHQLLLKYLNFRSHIRKPKYYFSFKRCYCHTTYLYLVYSWMLNF